VGLGNAKETVETQMKYAVQFPPQKVKI